MEDVIEMLNYQSGLLLNRTIAIQSRIDSREIELQKEKEELEELSKKRKNIHKVIDILEEKQCGYIK